MEKYLNMPVGKVVEQFPAVGTILNDYGIGCVGCVGTCLFKDVVNIHRLPPEVSADLLVLLEKAIYPQRDIKRVIVPVKAHARQFSYSPPVRRLVDEHKTIKRVLACIPSAAAALSKRIEAALVHDLLFFIAEFADKYHHAKEEGVLFSYCDRDAEIIKAMNSDHNTARGHVKAVREALANTSAGMISRQLTDYHDLLQDHIRKEDEILYPWIEQGLGTHQVGEIFQKFQEIEDSFDAAIMGKCLNIVNTVETRFAAR